MPSGGLRIVRFPGRNAPYAPFFCCGCLEILFLVHMFRFSHTISFRISPGLILPFGHPLGGAPLPLLPYIPLSSGSVFDLFEMGASSAAAWIVRVVVNVARCANASRDWASLESVLSRIPPIEDFSRKLRRSAFRVRGSR